MPGNDDAAAAAAMRLLRATLESAGREAGATQQVLQHATASFRSTSEEVISLVGGSAQGVDRDVVQALESAIHQTNAAVSALGAASSATGRF